MSEFTEGGSSVASFPFCLYSAAWRAAPFFLKRNQRLRVGWDERVLKTPLPRAHLWVQAASVGEAFLAETLLNALSGLIKPGDLGKETPPRPLTVLLTTNTAQGRELLARIASDLSGPGLTIHTAYFPLDGPWLMRRAVAQVMPRTAVLLESEIWPGFLTACRRAGTPTLLVNGRMSEKSRKRYGKLPGFFRGLAPDRILAMSPEDADRFGQVFGPDRVAVMQNIKFDRIPDTGPERTEDRGNPPAGLLPPDAPLAVFGSVREREEPAVLGILAGLLEQRPDAVIGLFPRHMHRLDAWRTALAGRGLPFVLRSETQGPATPGSVVLWDVFGEMGHAYALARTAFVGGSLEKLGGQNFLEPLAQGLGPIIGPHWANFAWVGREIVDAGLVRQVQGPDQVLNLLLDDLGKEPDRAATRTAFQAYVAPRRGGADQAAALVAETLKKAYNAGHPQTKPETS